MSEIAGSSDLKAEPGEVSRLAELRAKIDAIDESVHRLLMQRATVIDELIAVKGTARNGAAFRPAREADMMHRLNQRHEGHLPLTAIEHLWREIISTFTALQAPFDVTASTAGGLAEALDTARFYFGFSVPLHFAETAEEVVAAMEQGGDRLGLVGLEPSDRPWWQGLRSAKVVARLPFFETQDRPAATPFLVIAPPLADPAPPQISCYRVDGLSGLLEVNERVEVLAEAAYGGDKFSALLACEDGEAALRDTLGADLDIRPVGGYAAPLRV